MKTVIRNDLNIITQPSPALVDNTSSNLILPENESNADNDDVTWLELQIKTVSCRRNSELQAVDRKKKFAAQKPKFVTKPSFQRKELSGKTNEREDSTEEECGSVVVRRKKSEEVLSTEFSSLLTLPNVEMDKVKQHFEKTLQLAPQVNTGRYRVREKKFLYDEVAASEKFRCSTSTLSSFSSSLLSSDSSLSVSSCDY